MLDIKFIRKNKMLVRNFVKQRGLDPKIVDELLEKDKEYRTLLNQKLKLSEEKNHLQKLITDSWVKR